eukprot:scaffold672508_cov70-Prasinocladus_malaysianus.AAC.1
MASIMGDHLSSEGPEVPVRRHVPKATAASASSAPVAGQWDLPPGAHIHVIDTGHQVQMAHCLLSQCSASGG